MPSTSEAYDLWSSTYDVVDNPLVAQSEVALDELTALARGAAVLELGCGTGRLASRMLDAGAISYTGVDASSGMLQRAAELGLAGATWLCGELSAPPVPAASFDLVLFCLVLEHVRDLTPALAAARRALAPGGQVVVLELHAELATRGIGAHFEHQGQTVRIASFAHDAAELRAACAAAGLVPTRICEWFPDRRSLARSSKLGRYLGSPVLLELRASAT